MLYPKEQLHDGISSEDEQKLTKYSFLSSEIFKANLPGIQEFLLLGRTGELNNSILADAEYENNKIISNDYEAIKENSEDNL